MFKRRPKTEYAAAPEKPAWAYPDGWINLGTVVMRGGFEINVTAEDLKRLVALMRGTSAVADEPKVTSYEERRVCGRTYDYTGYLPGQRVLINTRHIMLIWEPISVTLLKLNGLDPERED